MTFTLSRETLQDIREHAVLAFPDECCGLIVERGGVQSIVRATNLQNELHARDPRRYPRTAATGYTMGPEAAPALIASEHGQLRLLAIYHSHPQNKAYFSEEDHKQACDRAGDALSAQAAQIVLSVIDGKVDQIRAFLWDTQSRDFLETAILEASPGTNRYCDSLPSMSR